MKSLTFRKMLLCAGLCVSMSLSATPMADSHDVPSKQGSAENYCLQTAQIYAAIARLRDKGMKREELVASIQSAKNITQDFKDAAKQVVDIIYDKLGGVDPSDIAVQAYGMCLKVVSSYKEV